MPCLALYARVRCDDDVEAMANAIIWVIHAIVFAVEYYQDFVVGNAPVKSIIINVLQ